MENICVINDIKNTSSPNAVNARGRKICPITLDILTCNNTINIDGVLYSAKGFSNWVRSELERDYCKLSDLCASTDLLKDKSVFVKIINIRSPMTNLKYSIHTVKFIYELFISDCFTEPIDCVYNFINKHNPTQ